MAFTVSSKRGREETTEAQLLEFSRQGREKRKALQPKGSSDTHKYGQSKWKVGLSGELLEKLLFIRGQVFESCP